jgi:tRNA(Ile)-lysidine synthase
VPLITEINPSVKTTVVNMCEGIREEKDYIYSNAEALVNSAKVKNGYNADILSANPKGLVKNALSKIIKSETGLSADRKTIDSLYEMVCLGKGKLNFLGNNFAAVSHSLLTFGGEDEDFELVLSADMGEKTVNGYSLFVINIENYKTFQKVHKKLLFTALDYDKIAGVAVARPRKIGDKITPVGAKITKSLKNIYNEKKIPTAIRGKIPVVADNCGVIMVSGYSVAERVKISEDFAEIYEKLS